MAGLEFVSISHPDDLKKRETRRRIGQHVMKDIGLSRRKQRPSKKAEESRLQSDSTTETTAQAQALSKPAKTAAHPTLEPEDDFKKSPITLLARNYAARSAKIQILLTRRNSPMCKKHREMYYMLALMEDGAYQLALADAALYEAGEPGGRFNLVQENPWAMQHYTACIAVINQTMARTPELSHTLVATIVGLASYDLTIRNFERWATHIKGLKGLLQGRGGLGSVRSEYIMHSILWSDMCGSLNIDSQPVFLPDTDYRHWNRLTDSSSSSPYMALSRTISILNARSDDFTDLCLMLQRVSDLSIFASGIPYENWVEDAKLVQTICNTSHNILNLPRYGEMPGLGGEGALFEAVRLAAVLFITGIACRLCGETDIVLRQIGRLETLLKSETIDWEGLEELRLWVYFLGARIEEGEGRQWFISQMCEQLRNMGMEAKSLRHVLRGISWVDAAMEDDTDSLKKEIEAAM